MLVPPSKAYFGKVGCGPQKLSMGASDERVEAMSVPGATRSGLIRRSLVGPRLLNAASDCGSPETFSWAIGWGGKTRDQSSPPGRVLNAPSVRSLRLAPTVSAFLHDAGELIDSQSTKPAADFFGAAAVPALPAAITTSMSGFLWTNSSTSFLFSVLVGP